MVSLMCLSVRVKVRLKKWHFRKKKLQHIRYYKKPSDSPEVGITPLTEYKANMQNKCMLRRFEISFFAKLISMIQNTRASKTVP